MDITSLYSVSIGVITILISIGIEWFIKPLPPNFYRCYTSYLLHFSIISTLYITVLLIVQRPIFSSLFVLITQVIFIVVSNAKYKALKEPLVFSDIIMFSQAFKYPRLYFPFLGWLPLIGTPIIIVISILLVIRFEPSLILNYPILILLNLIVMVIMYVMALQQKINLNIAEDIKNIGFIASLITYQVLSKQKKHRRQIEDTLKNKKRLWDKDKEKNKGLKDVEDIIVIQSESFFDVRRLHTSISDHVLSNFDQCCKESLYYGRLGVSAWGANTMRTEFSFLSGIGFEDMGYYRFYPYYYMRHYQFATLASYLQQKGYYCICIHPHHAKFFGRSILFPQVGFDEFIDIRDFSKTDKYGPYISDKAVSKKIIEKLTKKHEHNKPYFIFAITMENHGPLHLETISQKNREKYYIGTLPDNTDALSIYLRHLKNADEMIGSLMTELKIYKKNTLLCLYGDHVPSIPDIYTETGFNDNRTDYVIWSSKKRHAEKIMNSNKDISVQNLAKQIKNTFLH